jgi:hypothetical protein
MSKEKVFMKGNILVIHEGDDYYDTKESFEIDKLVKIIEEVGVKGGHIGWSIVHKKLDSDGEFRETEMMMGRKIRDIMEKIKEMRVKGDLKIGYEVREDMPTKCF